MQSATRALMGNPSAGACLPDVLEQLAEAGIHFRRSQLSMIVAGPGVGKSAVATILAARMGAGSLYFSADTNPHTMTCRLAAAVSGVDQETVDVALREGRGEQYLEIVDGLGHLQFCYEPSPDLFDIHEEVDCYAMVFGEYPEFIVVDNLMDVYAEGEDLKAKKTVLDELNTLARDIEAHVMVLHHAVGEYENGDKPIPLKGIDNKLGKKPTLILSLYRVVDAWTNSLGICPIKHRNGKADASGSWAIWHKLDLARMQLTAPKAPEPEPVNHRWQ